MTAGLTDHQLAIAQTIIAIAKQRFGNNDVGERAADIALGTGITESGLQNYANGNNPESLHIPHDAVGWDHGSVGVFQQQVGGAVNSTANWGTTAQCMNVAFAANTFFTHLAGFDWKEYTNWGAAQKVQGSYDASGGNYKRNDERAISIRKALWTQVPATPVHTPAPAPKPPAHGIVGTYTVHQGDNLTSIAHRYPQAWITAGSIAAVNHLSNPNLIYPGQVLKIG